MTRQFRAYLLAGISAFAAGPAFAQAIATETVLVAGTHQTDAVSGTKTETPILETPQSVNVITADQISEMGSQSVQQVLRYAPGVSSETRGVMTGLDYFYARGFAMDQYLNGLRTASGGYSYPQPDPYLLQSVEVLRGPASILYGQASPGGVVNLVSKKAGFGAVNEVEIETGSYGRIQGALDLSGDFSSDGTLSWRVAALAKSVGSQVDFSGERRYAVAPSLTWRPDDDTRLTLLASYQDDPKLGYYNWTPAYGTVLPNANGGTLPTSFYSGEPDFDRFAQKNAMLGYEFEHRFNDTFAVRQNLRFNNSGSQFRNAFGSFLDSDERTLYRYGWSVDEAASNVDVDTQLVAHLPLGEVSNTVLAGVDYQYLRFGQKLGYDFATVSPLDIFAPVYHTAIAAPPIASDDVQHSHQIGIYLQDQIAWGKWRLLLGGRQDWVESADTQYIDFNTGLPGPGVESSQAQSAFSGRVGLLYLFDMGLAPYASYTESFQPQSGTDFAGTPFQPTRGRQYEAGIKYQVPGTQSLITVALYDLKQSNVLATDYAHPGQSIQIGAITSQGVDVSGNVTLTGDLDLTASYNYVDQKVTAGDVDFGPALGAHPSNVPVDQAMLWANWRVPVAGLDGLRLGLGVRYTGLSYGADDNSFKVPSHTLVDGAVHYDVPAGNGPWSGTRLSLNATNLFDDTYVAGCGGYDYCGYGFRRSVQFAIARRF